MMSLARMDSFRVGSQRAEGAEGAERQRERRWMRGDEVILTFPATSSSPITGLLIVVAETQS